MLMIIRQKNRMKMYGWKEWKNAENTIYNERTGTGDCGAVSDAVSYL